VTEPATRARLAHLDGLRAVSIALVLAYHLAPEWVGGGFVGVDVFFVLSGFLITGILERALADGSWSVGAFYRRRVRRLFPALALVMAATLVAGWFYLSPFELVELGWQAVAGAGFGANFLLWGQAGYFDSATARKPLMHLWSLGVEEQFYVIWPWLVWGAWRVGGARALRAALPIVAALSFAVCLWLSWTDPTAAFYAPWSRVWELALGGVIATRVDGSRAVGPLASALSVFGLALLLAVGAGLGADLPPVGASGGPVLGACLLLLAGPTSVVNRALGARPLVALGEMSYALYLWHWPVFVFASLLSVAPLPAPARVDVLWISVALAWATTRWVERPLLSRAPTMTRTVVLSLGMTLVAAAGGAAIAAGGFPARFPEEVRALIAARPVEDRGEKTRCFLEPDQDATHFGPTCVDRSLPRRMVVWGDSHAAALTAGLRVFAAPRGVAVTQLTSSLCPPILGRPQPGHPTCEPVNASVFEIIGALRPEVVVLHSTWRYELDGLAATVEALRAAGVGRVVVVGPVPWWERSLTDLAVAQARAQASTPLLPSRLAHALLADDGDARVRASLAGSDAVFISARDALCDADGCLTRVGEGAGELTSYDGAHLSAPGAVELVRRIEPALWGDAQTP
jgi:peptidoglycan/LPS O-acetylase OafA/YrhL